MSESVYYCTQGTDIGYLLGFLLLVFLLFLVIINLLDLGLLLVVFFFFGLLRVLVRDLLLGRLEDVEIDGVGDEFGVLLDHLLDLALVPSKKERFSKSLPTTIKHT